MGSYSLPENQVYWYTLKKPIIKKLTHDIRVNVAIIGGGAAGLAAAHECTKRKLSVALLEQDFCGAGASGKSSGFISPDSELEAENLISRWGIEQAKLLWDFSCSGVEIIRQIIKHYDLACDYQDQETLFIANGWWGYREVIREHEARLALKYPHILYTKQDIATIIGSTQYRGAIGDTSTFAINAYLYCQGLKHALQDLGAQIYENSRVLEIKGHKITTAHASVTADFIIVAVDKFLPEFQKFTYDIYHAQTFLLISEPLTNTQVQTIFPTRNCMITDTALVFNYYRVTGDNRLLLGGADLMTTYACCPNYHATRVYNKLIRYFNQKFPRLSVTFEYIWPGLIGISKDLLPIAQADYTYPYIYYIGAATGLSWATALGGYSIEKLLDNTNTMDHFFTNKRSFIVTDTIQTVIGTKLTFALGNFINKYIR